MQTQLQKTSLNITLCLERLVKSSSNENINVSVTTVIPLSFSYGQGNSIEVIRIVDSVMADSVIAYLEQLTDPATVQALEYCLNQNDTSMSQLCRQPQKISNTLYDLIGDASAQTVIDRMIEGAYKTLGFKFTAENNPNSDNRRKLANSIATLKRMVLEANNLSR